MNSEENKKDNINSSGTNHNGRESDTPNPKKEKAEEVKKLESLTNRILYTVSSVFPFNPFPTSVTAEETKLIIVYRQFWTSQVQTLDISQVSNVSIVTGLIFAQITIFSDVFPNGKKEIPTLWKEDAIKMHRIIEGLKLLETKGIKTTEFPVSELMAKLKELSTTENIL